MRLLSYRTIQFKLLSCKRQKWKNYFRSFLGVGRLEGKNRTRKLKERMNVVRFWFFRRFSWFYSNLKKRWINLFPLKIQFFNTNLRLVTSAKFLFFFYSLTLYTKATSTICCHTFFKTSQERTVTFRWQKTIILN